MFSARSLVQRFLGGEGGDGGGPDDGAGDRWPYEWTETGVEKVHGAPVISHASEDDPESVFAGPLARQMIEGPRNDPDQPLFVGVGTRKGRHVGIDRKHLFRNTAVFGVPGYGKSTLLKNSAKQVIESGHGCCFADPKGQDSVELMQIIPDHRIDDVVWIEPGQARSAVAGFNFLEVGVPEDDPMYDTAVENVVADLKRMVGGGDYWGPLMDGVCSNLIRGTTRLEYDFNMLDIYYLLISEEARQKYASMLDDAGLPFLADYAHKIEEMEDDDLDALQRRFKDWVEDPLARSTIAHRDTDIDIEDIVNNDKILIVRMAEQSEDLKQMIGTAILRRIWSAIRARAQTYDRSYDPFFLFADEFDLIATKDSSVPTMLSKARSLSLALFLCCQHPGQLPPGLVNSMYATCDTVLSFSPGSPKDAKAVAKNLDMDPTTLRHESNYHVWTQLTLTETRERSEAFRTYTLPPFPPVRSEAEAMHAIERTVRELGREPLSDDEMRRGLILGDDVPDADLLGNDDSDGMTTEDQTAAAVRAIHEEWLSRAHGDGDTDRWVPATTDAMVNRMARYVDESITDASMVWEHYQRAETNGYIEHTERDGDEYYRVTDAGLAEAWAKADEGGRDHRLLIADTHALLMGYDIQAEMVTGPGEPDLVGELAEHLRLDTAGMETGEILKAAEEHKQRLESEAPAALALTGGDTVNVEAEHSTGATGQRQTVLNLGKAYRNGRRCLFACRSDVADKVVNTLSDPPLAKDESGGIVTLYNHTQKVSKNGITAVIPNTETVTWKHKPKSGEWWVENDAGDRVATFDSTQDIYTNLDAYPDTTETLPDETYGADGPHLKVAKPVTAEEYFGATWNDLMDDLDDAYVVLDVPEGARRDPSLSASLVTEHHDRVPLEAIGQAEGETDTDDDPDPNESEDEPDDSSSPSLDSLRIT